MSKPMQQQKKYIDIINEIDKNFSVIKNMRPIPASSVKYFIQEFGISATHSSNAIEGNTFTYDETKYLLEKGIAIGAHSFRENQDIVGYKKGFDFLYEALKESKPISEEFIKKIHSFVYLGEEEAGQYRVIQNYVGDRINITFKPCAPELIQSKMAEYVKNLQADSVKNSEAMQANLIQWNDIFVNLAKHHIEFEKIHPFIDGNGRTGRLLLTYEMISLGLLPIDIRYEERDRYYSALKVYDDKVKYSTRLNSELEPMAKLLAECELSSMNSWTDMFASFIDK